MKIEGRLLLFDVENADGSRISPDCKIDIPEKVPIVNDFNFNDPNSCIGSASVSIDEKGLIFTGNIPDDFDTDYYPGCGGYYTGVTYLNTTLVSMRLKCVGLVKKAVNSAYKYVKGEENKVNNMHKPNDRCTNFEVRDKGDGVLEMIKLNCDICPIDKLTCGVYSAYNKAKTYSVSFKIDKEKKDENNNLYKER